VQMHHLILDGVAIRILVEDLNLVYKQLRRGESVRLPAKTTSYRTWAERLLEYAHTPEVEADVDYWLGQPWNQAAALPMDGTLEPVGGGRVASIQLDEQETARLLRGAAEESTGGIQPLLLAATVQSIAAWTNSETHLVNMWSHGRDPLFPGIDLSRTFGWCTAEYPVLLSIAPEVSLREASESARRQLASVPRRGISYDLLRHVHTNTSIRERMQALPAPCITFNYQGKYAETLTTSGPFTIDDAHVHDAKPYLDQAPLSPDLNISSKIVAGSLTIVLRCHSNAYEQYTLDRVASDLHQRILSFHVGTERAIALSTAL
jgi:non-ribosomal peptide synthase protein (TIGR01720 family)